MYHKRPTWDYRETVTNMYSTNEYLSRSCRSPGSCSALAGPTGGRRRARHAHSRKACSPPLSPSLRALVDTRAGGCCKAAARSCSRRSPRRHLHTSRVRVAVVPVDTHTISHCCCTVSRRRRGPRTAVRVGISRSTLARAETIAQYSRCWCRCCCASRR